MALAAKPISLVPQTLEAFTAYIGDAEAAMDQTLQGPFLWSDLVTGYGFLWRLYSYWRFQACDAGVYLDCRAISLTRDVPSGLGWAINPIINKLPKESLTNTLVAKRQALQARAK